MTFSLNENDTEDPGMGAGPSFSGGVIFDCDGVIVDTYPWHRDAILQLCKRYHDEIIALDDKILRTEVFGRPNHDWIPHIFTTTLNNERIQLLSQEKEMIFRELIRGRAKPLEGLADFLFQLRKHKIPIAVASSAPSENIRLILAETKLPAYFDAVLDDTSVKHGKPAPDIYIEAARIIGVPAHHCVVFEDSSAGITAGRNAGCAVIGVATTHDRREIEPHVIDVIHDFKGVGIGMLSCWIEQKARQNDP